MRVISLITLLLIACATPQPIEVETSPVRVVEHIKEVQAPCDYVMWHISIYDMSNPDDPSSCYPHSFRFNKIKDNHTDLFANDNWSCSMSYATSNRDTNGNIVYNYIKPVVVQCNSSNKLQAIVSRPIWCSKKTRESVASMDTSVLSIEVNCSCFKYEE
jgi:hypothetical protein